MLTFSNLTLSLDDKPIIRTASGQIRANQIIVLTGASGSGKSLLLKILSSLIVPTSGQIFWQKEAMQTITPVVWRSRINYVSQHSQMITGSILDNLMLPFSLEFYKQHKFDRAWIISALEQLGKADDFINYSADDISGGERQIVNILRHLQLSPPVMLFDEPTSALDDKTTQAMEHLIVQWQVLSQSSFVVISHSPSQCDRLLNMGAVHWQIYNGVLMVGD